MKRCVFCSISYFLNEFLTANVTKFATFCKQKTWREKPIMALGVCRGDYGPLINQSELAYYLSHIIMADKRIKTIKENLQTMCL